MKLRLRKKMSVAAVVISICAMDNPGAYAQWTPVGTAGFTPQGNINTHVFVGAPDTAYVSFGNAHGEVMKFDGTNWVQVGGTSVTPGKALDCWSAMGPNKNIYFSYADGNDHNKATVSMYNGTAWAVLGSALSADTATNTSVVVTSAGQPYASYIDKATGNLYVQTYTGSAWQTVSGGAVTTTGAAYPCMSVGKNDTVFIAYQDQNAAQNATVKKFDGQNWVTVGSSFCAQPFGGAFFLSMAVDTTGMPCLAYMCPYPMGPSVCVSKFDGTNWNTVGAAGFSSSGSIFISMTIDRWNTPYVSYTDGGTNKAFVKKYDGASWTDVGTAGISTGNALFTSITSDANKNPFVAYMENNGGTTVMRFPVCTPSEPAVVSASDTLICKGDSIMLRASGILNDATNWYWTSGSCGGAYAGTGDSIKVGPADTTVYYVHGSGGCVLSSICSPLEILVDNVVTPIITANMGVLTSDAATGNQWYKNGVAVSGANGQSYTPTGTGWYKTIVTNANNCSAASDSVFITPAGVAQLSISVSNIYPSPFHDQLQVTIQKDAVGSADSYIVISDNLGRTVYEQTGLQEQNTLDVSRLQNGFYWIKVKTGKGTEVKKIVKLQ